MFKQSFLLISSDIISKIVLFLFQIVLARQLGPESFGTYAIVITFSAMFIVFSNYGLDVLVARDIANAKENSSKYLKNLLLLKIPISAITIFAMFAVAILSGYSSDVVIFMVFASISTISLSYNRLFFGFFRAYGILRYEAFITTVDRGVSSFLGIGLVVTGFGLMSIFFSASVISIGSAWISYYILKNQFISSPHHSFELQFVKKIAKEAAPLLLLAIFSVIYFQIDVIILSFMKGDEAVGLYSSVMRLLSLFQFIPGAVVGVLLPLMSQHFMNKDKRLVNSLRKGSLYMAILGISAASFIFLFANQLVEVFYSNKFLGAVPALKILILSLPFYLVNPILGNFLIACNSQKLPVFSVAITSLINIVFNIILIPKYSFTGAAVSKFISEIFLFLIQGYFSIALLSSIGIVGEKPLSSHFYQSVAKKETSL